MIRTLLTTTAVAVLMGTSAFAQTTTPAPTDTTAPAAVDAAPVESGAMEETDVNEPWDMSQGYVAADTDNLGSRLIGQPVFSTTGDDAEEIGSINDLVFADGGQIEAVVIGVGGFLGIGEKNVAVDFGALEFTLAADNTERWVLPTTAEALTAAPDFVWADDEPADVNDDAMAPADGNAMAPADNNAMAPADNTAIAPADNTAMAPADNTAMAPADNTAMTPADPAAPMAMPREGYADIDREALTAENLTGATVIGPDGDDIAEVGDLLLTDTGEIDAMVVDFGGFLGIGQKRVAVGLDNLTFASNEGGDLVIYSDFTREQLEAAPDYDEATYATDPAQRMTDM